MGLFDRVFKGSDEMLAIAESEVASVINELGDEAPVGFPGCAYHLPCIYAYLGKKVTKLSHLQESLEDIEICMTREQKLGSAFSSGTATAMAAEVIEACKYARSNSPYEDTIYHGALTDAEVRELGVPLVTGDIPGFVVIIDKAPTVEAATVLIKEYQRKGIFVFLIGGIIDQAVKGGLQLGANVRVVPVGQDIWSVGHIISVVVRAAIIFGAIKPGDWEAFDEYTFHRIRAYVNAFAPLADITVACGAGAISMGFPVITNEIHNIWRVPKSLIVQEDVSKFIETSIEARDIKLKITDIDIPVAFSPAYEGELIRRPNTHVIIDGSHANCFELLRMKGIGEVADHQIVVDGPDFDDFYAGSEMPLAIIVDVAGKNMQSDFEPVIERKIHYFLNCIEGVMHAGQRDLIRIRVSNDAFAAGLRARHLGEVIYTKVKSDYNTVVDKCQVTIVTDPKKLKTLRDEANEIYDKRDTRLLNLTDESVDVFYNCILCQSFSPAHVCVVTPERLGLCGAVSWLDAKASHELDPDGPCQLVTKNNLIDEKFGSWDDVNEAVHKHSHGAIDKVTLYSILRDPMTSCGCFECICGIEPGSNGVVIVNREHDGFTPLGMTFSTLASMTGGGVQTPGFMGHGKHFIPSKKFLKAEGGVIRIVWMPKVLKNVVREKLDATAKELFNIDDFCSKIADETVTEDDPAALMAFLTEKRHPVLKLEPFDF